MKSNEDIAKLKAARRQRLAEEISDALEASGMTRKAFAEAMHRQPSEVTKWLSGNHNFTCDLLEEISSVLGVSISGADNIGHDVLVDGYGHCGTKANALNEPAGSAIHIELSETVTAKLRAKASGAALTLRQYICQILCDKAEEKPQSAMEFCGIWSEDMPSAEEIRSMRTQNTFPDIF